MEVVAALQDMGQRAQGMASAAQLVNAGITRSQLSRALAAGEVVRVRRGVYALAPLPPLPRYLVTPEGVSPEYVAHVRSALLALGPSAIACGRTAAVLFGWPLLVEPVRTLEIGVPHGRSHARAPGVVVRRHRRLEAWRRHVVPMSDAVWMTSPVQTLVDCALTRPLVEAVVIWDSALRARHVTLDDLARAQQAAHGARAAARVRRVLSWVSDDSGSVPESVLRLRLLQAGLDVRTQHVILDEARRHLLRADFCFPQLRLVVEVDGARWHLDTAKDQRTDNALAANGWRVLRYAGGEVLHGWRPVVAEVKRACAVTPVATSSTHLVRLSAA